MAKRATTYSKIHLGAFLVIGFVIGLTVWMAISPEKKSAESQAAKRPVAPSSIVMNEDPATLTLGSTVTFVTEANGLRGTEYPMVVVRCWQNDELTYGQLDHPDVAFVLGGGSSTWKTNGGPAVCKASLYSYGGKSKGYSVIDLIAETPEFNVQ